MRGKTDNSRECKRQIHVVKTPNSTEQEVRNIKDRTIGKNIIHFILFLLTQIFDPLMDNYVVFI